jgi:hypothetical protein
MSDFRLNTPVALTIFNRPDTTAAVFAQVAKARPPSLLVVADGPRPHRVGDPEKCAAAREIIERVDWDCELLTNYSEVNLGCKQRMASGLDWVFDTVDRAIILEDDCLPHPTFFRFCEELLERYQGNEDIMMVAGSNFGYEQSRVEHSYYFSRYTNVWGWASWRRAWRHFDVDMSSWPMVRDAGLINGILGGHRAGVRWTRAFDRAYEGSVDTWDTQWKFACWLQGGLTVLPTVNLVSNVGFGSEATHTTSATHRLADMPTRAMDFPLRHPPLVVCNGKADDWIEKNAYHVPLSSLLKRVVPKVKKLIAYQLDRGLKRVSPGWTE